jgi:hypothetical protein
MSPKVVEDPFGSQHPSCSDTAKSNSRPSPANMIFSGIRRLPDPMEASATVGAAPRNSLVLPTYQYFFVRIFLIYITAGSGRLFLIANSRVDTHCRAPLPSRLLWEFRRGTAWSERVRGHRELQDCYTAAEMACVGSQ